MGRNVVSRSGTATNRRPAQNRSCPNEAITVDLGAGDQADYVVRVADTREYTISTFGATDTCSPFEEVDGSRDFLAGDDDSGTDRTASITYRLRPQRTYRVRL